MLHFNNDYPDEQKIAELVFEAIKAGLIEGFISTVVQDEIEKATESIKNKLLKIIGNCKKLKVTEEVLDLAERYIKEGAFPQSKPADATHVAVASFYGLDYIFSWNFRHIVRESTITKVTAINQLLGYRTPKIINPEEVILDVLEK
ncbi:type II toxin-antitoxin system VapC family toxin [Candidatus Gottesmanbacteria bacterium]|nr:type II toxin-antitoxin system VapC family toxin [Candidatus Gottesmanbacteria bacterium]